MHAQYPVLHQAEQILDKRDALTTVPALNQR